MVVVFNKIVKKSPVYFVSAFKNFVAVTRSKGGKLSISSVFSTLPIAGINFSVSQKTVSIQTSFHYLNCASEWVGTLSMDARQRRIHLRIRQFTGGRRGVGYVWCAGSDCLRLFTGPHNRYESFVNIS